MPASLRLTGSGVNAVLGAMLNGLTRDAHHLARELKGRGREGEQKGEQQEGFHESVLLTHRNHSPTHTESR